MTSAGSGPKAIPIYKNHGTFTPSTTPPLSPANSRPSSPPRAGGDTSTPALGSVPLYDGPSARAVPSSVSSMHHRNSLSVLDFDLDVPLVDKDLIPHDEAVSDSEDIEDVRVPMLSSHRRSTSSRRGNTHQPSMPSINETNSDWHNRRDSRDSCFSIISEEDIMTKYPSISRQHIYLQEEDMHILICGFKNNPTGYRLYLFFSIITLGIVSLLAHWLPKIWIQVVGQECDLKYAEWVVVEDQWHSIICLPIHRKYFNGFSKNVFGDQRKDDQENEATDISKINMKYIRYFDYRYIRLIYHPLHGEFVRNNTWMDNSWRNLTLASEGINRHLHEERQIIFGPNMVEIEAKSTLRLLIEEVLHPFYVFQVVSIFLWLFDNYYYYAACIIIISATSITSTLLETKKNNERMREMSRFQCNIRVKRNGLWRYVNSSELVPGDIFDVFDPELHTFPCDVIMLSGDCIVNESMLTGESVPVSKIGAEESTLANLDLSDVAITPELSKHFLFSGTRLVRVRKGRMQGANMQNADTAIALVVRTGFNTTKGALVRSMLFPKPNGFKFYRDSFRFIGFLGCIAGLGFCASAINFVKLGIEWQTILIRALDLVTIVVPPALPATMSIGTAFAITRLRKANIFCISPTRVNVGGKVDCMCFDKTGTLTEDGLDVLGVHAVDKEKNMFSDLIEVVEDISRSVSITQLETWLLYTMTTCHSIRLVDGELIGDPLDLKMFEFTGWILEEGGSSSHRTPTSSVATRSSKRISGPAGGIVITIVRPPNGKGFDIEEYALIRKSPGQEQSLELGIIRSFEFVSALRRMSVIVRRLGSMNLQVFVKGAPEVMVDICNADTFPQDYDKMLSQYTHRGYRVIACATKTLSDVNWIKAQRLKREEIEKELDFVGFIVFENKIKSGTAPTVQSLRSAHIRQVMCTGDNVLTAISVSRECGLVSEQSRIYVARLIEKPNREENSIVWESVDDPRQKLDQGTLLPEEDAERMGMDRPIANENPFSNSSLHDYHLAVTGNVFRWMVDYAQPDTLNRMLVKSQIFARMSPDEKNELVQKLQMLGYCVGFCGDGANDCGALKAADIGLSLSEAEASVAAPFTSRSPDISCVLDVIREGRAALVTSFGCFKYMALYSLIQFTSISLLYTFASNLGDFQFLYIDLLLILPVAVCMGRTAPYHQLVPKRPTANLVSRKVLSSLIGQIFIQVGFQIGVFFLVRQQSWYEPPVINNKDLEIENAENTSLFLISSFQYLVVAIVFSVGPPYRKSLLTNVPLMICLVALSVLTVNLLISPPRTLFNLLQFVEIPTSFTWILFGIVIANSVISLAFEEFVSLELSSYISRAQRAWRRHRGKVIMSRKLYKTIEAEMRVK